MNPSNPTHSLDSHRASGCRALPTRVHPGSTGVLARTLITFIACGMILGSAPLPSARKATGDQGPLLLYYAVNNDGGFTDRVTPTTLRRDPARLEYIQTLPFDGLTFASDAGWELMQARGRTFDLAYMQQQFEPLRDLELGRLKHNFAVVNASKPGDFFDDSAWAGVERNFAYLARVLKQVGVEGILFDNEVYAPAIQMFNWNADCDDKSRSLDEYRAQARKRGREVMQAMVQEYPEIVVIFAHGPYISAPLPPGPAGTPPPFWPRQSKPEACELLGPFTVGFMEAQGDKALVVDGGEEYKFRTPDDFKRSYSARKYLMGSNTFNCPFVPGSLRGEAWSSHLSISFGVFAEDWPAANLRITPPMLQQCLVNALTRCDRYVWLYTQSRGHRFLTPGGVDEVWIQAVRNARAAVPGR